MDKTPEEQLFKWVKALINMPETGSDVIWRHTHKPIAGCGFNHFLGFTDGERWHDDAEYIEWLCPAPSPSAEVEALRRELEILKQDNKTLLTELNNLK